MHCRAFEITFSTNRLRTHDGIKFAVYAIRAQRARCDVVQKVPSIRTLDEHNVVRLYIWKLAISEIVEHEASEAHQYELFHVSRG